jgi:hypothetical protein
MEEQLERAAEIHNAVEASLVDAILSSKRIPHAMRSYDDSAYDGLFQLQQGWGCVVAPASQREAVRETVEQVRSENRSSSEMYP